MDESTIQTEVYMKTITRKRSLSDPREVHILEWQKRGVRKYVTN